MSLSRRGSENFGQESRAIVIRSLERDDERELLPKLAHIERIRWRPDSQQSIAPRQSETIIVSDCEERMKWV